MVIFDDQCHDNEGQGSLSYLLIVFKEGFLEDQKSHCKLMGCKTYVLLMPKGNAVFIIFLIAMVNQSNGLCMHHLPSKSLKAQVFMIRGLYLTLQEED